MSKQPFRNNHTLGHRQLKIKNILHHIDCHIVKWTPPQDGCVKLNIDGDCGSSNDNLGVNGLLRDNKRDWIVV